MKNKTERIKQTGLRYLSKVVSEEEKEQNRYFKNKVIEPLTHARSLDWLRFFRKHIAVARLIEKKHTEQIKKEAVWSFASYLAIKGVDSAKMLDYYDNFIKQYLEKGQNEHTKS